MNDHKWATSVPRGNSPITINPFSVALIVFSKNCLAANDGTASCKKLSLNVPTGNSPNVMSKGSRNGTLICTGPNGAVLAMATARDVCRSINGIVTGAASGIGNSADHLTCSPNSRI